MMSSRDKIIGKLRQSRAPFTDVPPPESPQNMVMLSDVSPSALRSRFVDEAEKLSCYVCEAHDDEQAYTYIMSLIQDDTHVMSWDDAHIPLGAFSDSLEERGVRIASYDDPDTRVGITGVDGALVATGSIIVCSGEGKYRATSLLPDIHVAVVKADQLLPDFEAWIAHQRRDDLSAFKQSSNTTIITGPSKTADIGQELIKGAHGPRQVHIILLD